MKLVRRAFLLLLVSGAVFAEDIEVVGSIEQSLPLTNFYSQRDISQAVNQVTLLKIELSDAAREKIDSRADDALNSSQDILTDELSNTKGKTQLGMGAVPVLDQGQHGTCVTFAVTAALDAALGKGDYLSQLCPLQLGRYLESNAYTHSGWNGSNGGISLNQLSLFGFISKAEQNRSGCGGLTDYPLEGGDKPGTEMTPLEYHKISEKMKPDVVGWSVILDIYHVFLDKTNMADVLNQVKITLDAGDRLTFGVILPAVDKGVAGAVGRYHAAYDSWVLTPEIIDEMKTQKDFSAHELIITGYDDNAVAKDKSGTKHKGLLTLRNSWGSKIGDKGDFYMSYDYFKALTYEAQRIRHVPS